MTTHSAPEQVAIPASHLDLLTRPICGVLTTMGAGDQPQSSLVWVDFDGACAQVNTTLERQKGRNLAANPKVSLLVVDPDNPGRYLQLRGHAELVFEGALAHLDKLTRKYTRHPAYYGHIYPAAQHARETGSSAASTRGASPWTPSTPEPGPDKELHNMDSTALAQQRHISITTFKRDGTPVSVPVWCAADNGTLLVISEADSWKVKRIRRNAHVRLAPCSARGKPRGPAVDADARLLAETTTVQALLAKKYPWAWPAYRALMFLSAVIRRLRRQLPTPWLTIRITLREATPDQTNLSGQELGSAGGQGTTGPAPAGRKLGSGDPSRVAPIRDGLRLLAAVGTAAVARRPVRPVAGEAERSLPGDELVADAKLGWTHAITIGARPAAVWPWLVQMGCRRAGWYSYDGLDNAGVPSAERILPEFQQVQVGDILPQAPTAQDRFVVRAVKPERALVLGEDAGSMSWAFVLEPVGATGTRLITRSRGAYDHLALGLLLKLVWHPVHFGMQRRQLLNLKRLVEAAT